jgi:hypothetical protein
MPSVIEGEQADRRKTAEKKIESDVVLTGFMRLTTASSATAEGRRGGGE